MSAENRNKNDGAPPLDAPGTIEIEVGTLDRILEMIRSVDSKTQFIMAVATAMIGVLASCLPDRAELTYCHGMWLAIGGILPMCSLVLCSLATAPKTDSKNTSLLFFGTIAAKSRDEYAKAVVTRTISSHTQDLISQVHRNAEIACEKYKCVGRAVRAMFFAIVPWAVAVYFLLRP